MFFPNTNIEIPACRHAAVFTRETQWNNFLSFFLFFYHFARVRPPIFVRIIYLIYFLLTKSCLLIIVIFVFVVNRWWLNASARQSDNIKQGVVDWKLILLYKSWYNIQYYNRWDYYLHAVFFFFLIQVV